MANIVAGSGSFAHCCADDLSRLGLWGLGWGEAGLFLSCDDGGPCQGSTHLVLVASDRACYFLKGVVVSVEPCFLGKSIGLSMVCVVGISRSPVDSPKLGSCF